MQDHFDNLMRWIRMRRMALGLTQTGLAGNMRVGVSTVCCWENGTRRPKPSLIPPLATALHATPEDIAARIVAEER